MTIIRLFFSFVCITILNQNTINAFTWKKMYTAIVPQEIHKETIFEEYTLASGTLIVKNKRGTVHITSGKNSDTIFLKAIKKSSDTFLIQ